jgi:hypothetical protein
MEAEALGQLGEGGLGRLSSRGGDQAHDRRLGGQPPVGLDQLDRAQLTGGAEASGRRPAMNFRWWTFTFTSPEISRSTM